MNIDSMLEKYGRYVELFSSSGNKRGESFAFISPLRYKNKMYLYGVNTEIGYNPQGYYLYIGSPNPVFDEIAEGGSIVCGDEKYRIDRAEKVYKGSEIFYVWAIIRVVVETEEEEK